MNKKEFIAELNEIIEDPIFIGKSIDDLFNETGENTWGFSMGQELANEFTMEELVLFFTQVQNNRKEQIVQTSDHPMIFYAWFDWQTASLKFSLISAFHKNLPFNSPYKIIASIEPIIADFLQFPFHDGFPITEINEEIFGEMEEEEEAKEPFNVFSVLIPTERKSQ